MKTLQYRLHAVVALLARVAIGVVFIAHGWQKLHTDGIDATAKGFAHLGIPLPGAAAWYAALVELGGGSALIVGLALPVVGVLIAADMAGAFAYVHAGNGLFSQQGGFEYVMVLGVGALLVGVAGGPLSLDHLVLRRFLPGLPAAGATAPAAVPAEATAEAAG